MWVQRVEKINGKGQQKHCHITKDSKALESVATLLIPAELFNQVSFLPHHSTKRSGPGHHRLPTLLKPMANSNSYVTWPMGSMCSLSTPSWFHMISSRMLALMPPNYCPAALSSPPLAWIPCLPHPAAYLTSSLRWLLKLSMFQTKPLVLPLWHKTYILSLSQFPCDFLSKMGDRSALHRAPKSLAISWVLGVFCSNKATLGDSQIASGWGGH